MSEIEPSSPPRSPENDSHSRSPEDDSQSRSRIVRPDAQGRQLVDALAGRSCLFGFGFAPVVDAIRSAAGSYLGDGSAFDSPPAENEALTAALREVVGEGCLTGLDSVTLAPSPDVAIDSALARLRMADPQSRVRTIAFVGSDHGRTGMCRAAGGRPELSAGLGPTMAGFTHVPRGDLAAVAEAIDDQTAAVLLSPLDFSAAARSVDREFLIGLRQLCDEHQISLVIDETQLVFAAAGSPFSFSHIAPIAADVVIASAGLFGGLPGGLVLASHTATGSAPIDTGRYPILAAVLTATLTAVREQDACLSANETASGLAVAVAEAVGRFDFVRDIHRTGMTIGVETDIDAHALVDAAWANGLRIEAAGDIAFVMQLPVIIDRADQQWLLEKLVQTLETAARATTSVEV